MELPIYESSRFGAQDYFEVSRNFDLQFPPHLHRCYELIYVVEGRLNAIVDNRWMPLPAGKAILFLSNQVHGFETEGHSVMHVIDFAPEFVPAFLRMTAGFRVPDPRFFLEPSVLELLSTSIFPKIGIDETHNFSELMLRKGLLYLVCNSFWAQVAHEPSFGAEKPLFSKAVEYIQNHFKEQLTLSDLARHLGYDYNYISHYLRDNLGMTFMQYLNNCRVSCAKQLLAETALPVQEVMEQSGFVCSRTFNKVFRQMTRTTPSKYREAEKMRS